MLATSTGWVVNWPLLPCNPSREENMPATRARRRETRDTCRLATPQGKETCLQRKAFGVDPRITRDLQPLKGRKHACNPAPCPTVLAGDGPCNPSREESVTTSQHPAAECDEHETCNPSGDGNVITIDWRPPGAWPPRVTCNPPWEGNVIATEAQDALCPRSHAIPHGEEMCLQPRRVAGTG